MANNSPKWALIIGGGFLVILGNATIFLIPFVSFTCFCELNLKIKNNTNGWDNWVQARRPLTATVYFFNITNPSDVIKGSKPKVVEVGPYVYQLDKMKINITRDTNKSRVFYNKWHNYTFIREQSVGNETDFIMTPNPLLFIELMSSKISRDHQVLGNHIGFINMVYASNPYKGVFAKRSVKEILFGGYEDIDHFFKQNNKTLISKAIPVPGLMFPPNNKTSPRFAVFTGRQKISNINLLDRFAYQNNLTLWSRKECNNFTGVPADYDIRPSLTDKTKSKVIRSLEFDYWVQTWDLVNPEKDFMLELSNTIQYEVTGKLYSWNPETFYNSETFPDKECYESSLPSPAGYLSHTTNKTGLPSGVRDMSKKLNASIIYSLPHFLYGDDYLTKSIEGMNPDPDRHSSSWLIEPKTGVTLNRTLRFQVNLQLSPSVSLISGTDKVLPLIYPVAWIEQQRIIHKDLMKDLDTILRVTWIIGFIIGPVLSFIGIILLWKGKRSKDDNNNNDMNEPPQEPIVLNFPRNIVTNVNNLPKNDVATSNF